MSEIKVDTLTGKTSAGDITVTSEGGAATMQLQRGLAKAWGRFGAAATIYRSLNLTSGTDHGTGDYSYSIVNPFTNLNYSMSGTVTDSAGGIIFTRNPARDESSVFGIETTDNNGSARDAQHDGQAQGDLA